MILGAGMLWDAGVATKQQEQVKVTVHYRNVYERPDGLQVVGHGWRDRPAADHAAALHGWRRVVVLRIRRKSA